MRKEKGRVKKLVRAVLVLAIAAAVGLVGVLTWKWSERLVVKRIEIADAQHADVQGLVRLVHVNSGTVLFDIEPAMIEDRVRRHPWVQEADVSRIPTGTLRIRIKERKPVIMVLGRDGSPAYYLDESGIAMPLVDSVAFDVPLVTELREAYRPGQAIENAPVLGLLGTLASARAEAHVLISEVEVLPSGELLVYTSPVGIHGSIPVRLGRSEFDEKLERLHAFWKQAVLPERQKTFAWIDLRFNSQIVTEETAIGQQIAAAGEVSSG